MSAELTAPSHYAARWTALVPGLAEHGLRVQLVRSDLAAAEPGELALGLEETCTRAERGERLAREVLLAVVPVLVDDSQLERLGLLRAAALDGGLALARRLLQASTTAGLTRSGPLGRDDDEESAEMARHPDGRPLTLGERRALARQPSRATLRRLLRDPHPMVVRLLLGNPRLTEQDVVTMAARRPCSAAIAREIAMAWTRRAAVRRALALNPGTPPGISVPLLWLLSRPELLAVGQATDLDPALRELALELHARKPPLEEEDEQALDLDEAHPAPGVVAPSGRGSEP